MAFCSKCGTQVEEGKAFCPSCGAQVGAPAQQAAPAENNFQETVQNIMNTPNNTAQFDQADINDNKIIALFAYLGILVLIPLLAKPESKFARFHANQGLVLWIASMILGVIAIIPILGWIVGGLGSIVTLVLGILGIVNAVQGQAKELPIIGKFTILK